MLSKYIELDSVIVTHLLNVTDFFLGRPLICIGCDLALLGANDAGTMLWI